MQPSTSHVNVTQSPASRLRLSHPLLRVQVYFPIKLLHAISMLPHLIGALSTSHRSWVVREPLSNHMALDPRQRILFLAKIE